MEGKCTLEMGWKGGVMAAIVILRLYVSSLSWNTKINDSSSLPCLGYTPSFLLCPYSIWLNGAFFSFGIFKYCCAKKKSNNMCKSMSPGTGNGLCPTQQLRGSSQPALSHVMTVRASIFWLTIAAWGSPLLYAWCSTKEIVAGLELSALEQTIGTGSSESVKITCISKGCSFSYSWESLMTSHAFLG